MLDNRAGRLKRFRAGFGIGCVEENLANPELGFPGGRAQPVEVIFNLVVGHPDTRAEQTAHQAVPGQVGANLFFQADRVHTCGDQLLAQPVCANARLGGHTGHFCVDFLRRHFNLEFGDPVELKAFIDQLLKRLAGNLLDQFR